MRDPSNWTEADLQALVNDKVQEDLHLDYKQSAALAKTDRCRTELSKDISAFANSDGGLIIYGIAEGKDNYPDGIDEGINAIELTREWLEQIITSNIHPKIDELRIYQIPLPSKGQTRVAYVVSIPQAKSRAPHQAKDKRYYRRYNFQSVPMDDYEIRDIYRRATTPELWIDFRFGYTGTTTEITFPPQQEESDSISIFADIGNRSREPALYAVVTIYVDELFTPVPLSIVGAGLTSSGTVKKEGHEGRVLRSFTKHWGVPAHLPIFAETKLSITAERPIMFTVNANIFRQWANFYIGYDIRAPGFAASKFVRVNKWAGGTLTIINQADS